MTLVVAAKIGENICMVSDTAITGGNLAMRQRAYQIKIVPSRDGRALVGFAGDHHYGRLLMERAASLSAGPKAVDVLTDGHRQYPSVDFVYGHIDEAGPHLIRISEGEVQEVPAVHLGLPDAFEHFQRIRHDTEIDPVPEAIITFICGARGSESVPQALSTAITSMLRLFAERSERDVGGWPVPYLLTKDGAFLCGYGYSVSDPILRRIGPGSVVPHGTPAAGGFGLSVTELGHGNGMVVYWLQRPGGTVFVRSADGYDAHEFHGTPSQFKQRVLTAVGEPIDLFFSEQPQGTPESITVMRDEAGVPSMAIAKHGDSLSFSVLNVGTPFRSRASLNLNPASGTEKPGGSLSTDHLSLNLSDDKRIATLDLLQNGQPATQIALQPAELDPVIAVLGEARAVMPERVSAQPRQDAGVRELMVLGPAWRTEPAVHSALNGITLRLRHPGFGWMTFLLPHHEALALGKWLCEYAKKPADPAPPEPPISRQNTA